MRVWPNPKFCIVVEAACLLCVAQVVVLSVPFGWVLRRLGNFVAADQTTLLQRVQEKETGRIASALRRAKRHLPFNAQCLATALAGWAMLRRRRLATEVHMGVISLSQDSRTLHVWLTSATQPISGFPEADHCLELGHYTLLRTKSQ